MSLLDYVVNHDEGLNEEKAKELIVGNIKASVEDMVERWREYHTLTKRIDAGCTGTYFSSDSPANEARQDSQRI